ncbi:MAG: phospholipid scramblase-related protein [Myxococcaceae bacterium]
MTTELLSVAAQTASELYVRQQRELAELFGFETRNKYAISTPDQQQVAFAAEQEKGLLGAIFRQVLGHWRTFEITFFGPDRQPLFRAVHPFRFFFQRLEVYGTEGRPLGAIQQRFAWLRKSFDVEGPNGQTLFVMRAPIFSIWKFPFFRDEREVAIIEKKWSGALSEMFTDKDNFRVRFNAPLSLVERVLILAAAIFVDLQYFERKASQ